MVSTAVASIMGGCFHCTKGAGTDHRGGSAVGAILGWSAGVLPVR